MKNIKYILEKLTSEFTGIALLPFYHLMTLLPISKRLVVFECGRGLSYSCNPKYIYEGLLKSKKNCIFIWSLKDISLEIPGQPIKVKRFGFRYYYYLARARFWIHNGEFGLKIRRRKGTTYINTQHGTPLKKMGIDIPYFDDSKRIFEKTSKWDYLISPNAYSTEIFKKAYRYHGHVLEIGYPRNDIFYARNNPDDIKAIKKKYGLPFQKKTILYAPTWRDVEQSDNKSCNSDNTLLGLNLQFLSQNLAETYTLVVRLHHLTSFRLRFPDSNGFLNDCSGPKYDIQELCLAADVLVTDYSSVMFDYAYLKRPMIFYAYDIDVYRDQIRGFYLDFPKIIPGPLVFDSEQLVETLSDFERLSMDYSQEYERFYRRFCHIEAGKATDQIIKHFFSNA